MKEFQIENNKSLKLKLIKDFIKENNRAPSLFELNELLLATKRDIPNVEKLGSFSPSLIPMDSELSASSINKDLSDIKWNLDYIQTRIETLFDSFADRATKISILSSSLDRYLSKLDSQASSLLLSKNFSSDLIYSITEDFQSSSNVQLELTTASLSEEGVSANYESLVNVTEYIKDIKFSVISSSGILSTMAKDPLENIKEVDGNFWICEVEADTENEISLILDIKLSESIPLERLVVYSDYNSLDILSLFYAKDDNNYKGTQIISMSSGLNTFNINSKEVSFLRLVWKKRTANAKTINGHFLYIYKFDALSLLKDIETKDSVIYCGPYTIVDSFDNPVLFNKVSLSSCWTDQTNSWIEYYLSNDNVTWIPVMPIEKESAGSIVTFETTAGTSDMSVVNELVDLNKLDYENSLELELETDTSYINMKADAALIDQINSNHISLKRNLPSSNTLYDITSGWFYDTEKSLYITTFIVNSDSFTLNLGSSSAYINDIIYTGTVNLEAGEYIFATNDSNWLSIEADIDSESELQLNDPLYPYNHKYLIEGYNYPATFTGNKVYNGVTEFFGYKLLYVSESVFINTNRLDVYTIKLTDDGILFLVKTKKAYADYINELFDLKINIPNSSNQSIYLKAVFKASDEISTSLLKSFTLRVA